MMKYGKLTGFLLLALCGMFLLLSGCDGDASSPRKGAWVRPHVTRNGRFIKGHYRNSVNFDKDAYKNRLRSRSY